MAKWIVVLLLCCGCAGKKARVTITRVNGEPAISFEIEESKKPSGNDDKSIVR